MIAAVTDAFLAVDGQVRRGSRSCFAMRTNSVHFAVIDPAPGSSGAGLGADEAGEGVDTSSTGPRQALHATSPVSTTAAARFLT
jgi:hypothetical protein